MMTLPITGSLMVLLSLFCLTRGIGIPKDDGNLLPEENQLVSTTPSNDTGIGIPKDDGNVLPGENNPVSTTPNIDTDNNEAPTVSDNNMMTTHRNLGPGIPPVAGKNIPSRSSCVAAD